MTIPLLKMENDKLIDKAIVKKHELVLSEQELDRVTVYTDRAEVVRFTEIDFDVGLNEIHLTKTPTAVDRDGIRVEGKGDAAIAEVSLQEQWVSPQESAENDSLKQMRSELEKLQQQEQALLKRIVRLSTKESLLNNYAESVTKFNSNPSAKDPSSQQATPVTLMNDDAFQTLTKFLDSVQLTGASIDDELSNANAEKRLLQQKIDALRRNIQDVEAQGGNNRRREIVVLVDAHTAGKVRLRVSYVVYGANWSATYDVRASSVDAAVQIHYHAMVYQTSGEEWNDVELALSTAKPAVSGRLPRLGTRFVKFREPIPIQTFSAPAPQMMMAKSHMKRSFMAESAMAPMAAGFGAAGGADVPDMTFGGTTVSSDQFNTAFIIARRSTIPSDGNARKVTIGIINVEADLVHKVVPRKSASAFITAKIRNTSNMALLAGPSNIFIDNTFVAKSSLDNVGPDENFVCSLGVDPAVRIDYKPLRKFHEQSSGLFSRSQREIYEQITEIINGRQNKIHLFVEDQLPKSSEDKIKVSLVEPQVSVDQQTNSSGNNVSTTISVGSTRMTVKITDRNNIEWEMNVRPNEKLNVPFKYQLEYPNDKELTEYETS